MTFALVLAILYIAMGSPLNLIAQRCLFTAYVLQMLLMTQVVPPLLFLALPSWVWESVATSSARKKFLKIASSPMVALIAYNTLAAACLLPGVVQANLSNDLVHFVLQGSLVLSAVFLWWPLMSTVQALPQLTPGAKLIYLLFAGNLMMPIAVFLFFSVNAWYPTYTQTAAEIGFPPIEDQQLGALLMAVGMLLIYAARALPAFVFYSESIWYK